MRYLLKVTALPEEILVLEELRNKLWPSHQDIPLPAEEDLDRPIFLHWLFEILPVRLDLVHVAEQRQERHPERDGRYIGRLPRRREYEDINGADHGSQEKKNCKLDGKEHV